MAQTPLWGPIATTGKDWTLVEDADQSTIGGDQGEGWPDMGSFILRGHNLHRLINKQVDKPDRNSVNADKWMKISMQIRAWLHCGLDLDPDIAKNVTSTGKRTTCADDFMHVCKKQMRGEGHGALSAAMLRFINIKRSKFTTTTEFIQGIKTWFIANDLKDIEKDHRRTHSLSEFFGDVISNCW